MCMWISSCSSTICWKNSFFHWIFFASLWKISFHIYVGLFLSLHSIPLIYLCILTLISHCLYCSFFFLFCLSQWSLWKTLVWGHGDRQIHLSGLAQMKLWLLFIDVIFSEGRGQALHDWSVLVFPSLPEAVIFILRRHSTSSEISEMNFWASRETSQIMLGFEAPKPAWFRE